MKISLGKYNDLKVTRTATRPNPHAFGGKETFGVFVEGGPEGDILMPEKYVPEGTKVGDTLHCFVYLDQDERPIATTEKPLAQVGDFAWLKCTWVNEYGAFLDWGLMKDVFCPFHEQKRRMEIGHSYLVYITVDEESYRIMASAKVEKYFTEEHPDYRTGQQVDLLVWQKSPLGFKVIVDNRFPGLIYDNQIFQAVYSGDRLKGYIQQVRPDGKIDVALQPSGQRQTEDFAQQLLDYLKAHNGRCDLGDKSDAEEIRHRFQVSKKVYKRAIGDLYKRRLIQISDQGIELTQGA